MLAEMNTYKPTGNGFWDRVGLTVASICAIHCLLLPVILVALPWLDGIFPHNWFHIIILGITIPLACFAFYHGIKQHHSWVPIILAGFGIMGLISGVLMHEFPFWEKALSLSGSFMLLLGHAQNIRRCRCHHDHNAGHFCRHDH